MNFDHLKQYIASDMIRVGILLMIVLPQALGVRSAEASPFACEASGYWDVEITVQHIKVRESLRIVLASDRLLVERTEWNLKRAFNDSYRVIQRSGEGITAVSEARVPSADLICTIVIDTTNRRATRTCASARGASVTVYECAK